MRRIDWTAPEPDVATSDEGGNNFTYTAERVIVGNCPQCDRALVVFNDHESWPLVACACGWRGSTSEFVSTRFEHGARPTVRVTAPSFLRYVSESNDAVQHVTEPVAKVAVTRDPSAGATLIIEVER